MNCHGVREHTLTRAPCEPSGPAQIICACAGEYLAMRKGATLRSVGAEGTCCNLSITPVEWDA